MVFLPNAPAAGSGQMALVKPEQVQPLDLSLHRMLDMYGFYAVGMSNLVSQGLARD